MRKQNRITTIHKVFGRLLMCALLLSASFSTFAASVRTMPLSELTSEASDIVLGRCTTTHSRWQDDKIVTDATIDVSLTLKGDETPHMTITLLGGTAMHPRLNVPVTMNVPGGAVFKEGEEVLVFSKTSASGIHQLVGLSQGKFLVETDVMTGEKVIPVGQKKLANDVTAEEGLGALLSAEVDLHDVTGTDVHIRRLRLDELVAEIQLLIQGVTPQ